MVNEVNCDAILAELGQFGRYQLYNYLFLIFPIMFNSIYFSQYIFNAGEEKYRCAVPECESPPYNYETGEWGLWAIGSAGSCARMRPSGACAQDAFDRKVTVSCGSYVYGGNDTIVAEFGLACQEWRRTLVGTIHSSGLFAALPITGYVSDAYGRRMALVLTAASAATMGLIRSFSVNYYMYLVFEFLDSTLGSGVFHTGYILALEMVGMQRRVLGGNMIACSFATGHVVLAAVAWKFPYWRTLTRILYIPSFIFIFYYFFIEESVRWLLSKGRKQEAARIIFKAAAINKKELSPESLKQLADDSNNEEAARQEEQIPSRPATQEKSLFMQVLRSKIIMSRLLICSFWWITVTFIYYGLSINSVSLAGNKYMNFILASLVEIPGYAMSVLTLDRFGRKSSISKSFLICGFVLITLPFIPNATMKLAINMLAKACISMNFSSIYIYTVELVPTAGRASCIGFCSMMGRFGNLLAPSTPLLMSYMEPLPYLLFGMMAGCSGGLMMLMPETLRVPLPDTIEQAEAMEMAPSTEQRTATNR